MNFTLFTILVTLVVNCKCIPMGNIKSTAERMHPEFRNIPYAHRYRPEEYSTEFWFNNAKDFISKQLNQSRDHNRAKNIILFIGDGMSLTTQAAARVYKGVKNNYGTIGISGKVPRSDCAGQMDVSNHVKSIAKWAIDAGKSAGLVTTTRVTDASPAGVYASIADRDWCNDAEIKRSGCDDVMIDDIAEQLVHGDVGSKLKVVLGCGTREFIDNSMVDDEGFSGARSDKKNLINEWLNAADQGQTKRFVWNKTELVNIDPSATDYLMGLFDTNDCRYNLDIINENIADKEPTLTEMMEKAIDILSKDENGFFLFVEGGRIDHAHHSTKAHLALEETLEFDRAIALARSKLSEEDTLIVVSADHSHTMTYAGYGERGADIFGLGGLGEDGLPYMTLTYANGPGYAYHTNNGGRLNLTEAEIFNYNFMHPATVPMGSETHAGDDVGVFASGPGAQLFTGVLEQNVIPHFMAYAACIGNGLTACD